MRSCEVRRKVKGGEMVCRRLVGGANTSTL